MDFLMNLGEGTQFTIQLAIVLICLFYGAKKGGIRLWHRTGQTGNRRDADYPRCGGDIRDITSQWRFGRNVANRRKITA